MNNREQVEGQHLYHYTTDEVANILSQARQAITAADISNDLAPIAFERAVNLISVKSILGRASAITIPGDRGPLH